MSVRTRALVGVVALALWLQSCSGGDGGDGSGGGTLSFVGGQAFVVSEDGTPAVQIVLRRFGGSSGVATVVVTPTGGTATGGTPPLTPPADFDATPITVTFADGDSADKVVTIPILDDGIVEPDETLTLTLSSRNGANLGAFATATLTITNNDFAGSIEFASTAPVYNEDGSTVLPIVVRRVGGAAGTVSAAISTLDGTANSDSASLIEPVDYAPFMTTVVFGDGDVADKTIVLSGIVQDVLPEADETIDLILSAPTGGAALGAQATASVSVIDDDAFLLLPHPSPTAGDRFGAGVASAGGRILIGAPFRTVSGFGNAGTVSVFDPSNGSIVSTISNPVVGCLTQQFGAAMAGSGRSVYISAPGPATCGNGLAYEYDALTGAQLRQLTPPNPTTVSTMGFAVFTDLVAGVDGATAVRLYDRRTGAQVFSFGPASSIATLGPLLIVGDTSGNQNAGVAYVFDPATQTSQIQIANPFRSSNDGFGTSVADFDGMVAVGAAMDDTAGTDAGSTYAFDPVTGSLGLTLLPQAPLPVNGRFGNKITAVRDRLAVQQLNGGTSACGRVFIFDATGALIQTIDDPSPTANANFGSAMVEFDGALVVGAPMQTVSGAANAGRAWVFKVN
jgi:hypothetical protein